MQWRRELEAEDAHTAAHAAFQLGGLAMAGDRLDEAIALLLRAVQCGDVLVTPRAHFELGRIWIRRREIARAEKAFAAALASSTLDATPDVIVNVARERARGGQPRDACDLFRSVLELADDRGPDDIVVASRRAQMLAFTALWYGEALLRLGDADGAEREWRRVLAANDRGASPRAALLLATELPTGRLASTEIEELLGLAQYFDHPDVSPRAGLVLAELHQRKQMTREAEELRRDVVLHSGHPQAIREARARLRDAGSGGARKPGARLPGPSRARRWRFPRRRLVLIVGAGTVGQDLVRELQARNDEFYVCGYLDDAPKPERLDDVPVLGPLRALGSLLARRDVINEVLFTIPCSSGTVRRAALQACREHDVPMRTLPNVFELLPDRPLLHQLRDVRIDELYERRPVVVDRRARVVVRGRAVLVSGAGGTIGRELARQIAAARPKLLVLLDRSDGALAELDRELIEDRQFAHGYVVVTDCGQPHSVDELMEIYRPEVIFHGAGYDHADVLSHSGIEAVRNNALATRTLASAAGRIGVERFILVSSDAAASPRGLFGASKALAELVMDEQQAMHPGTTYATVRVGEVFNAPGSVVRRFERQIRKGGPVTIAGPDAERRYLPSYLAAQWLLRVAEIAQSGQLYALEGGEPIRTAELARELIRLRGWKPDEDIKVVRLDASPGEPAGAPMSGGAERAIPTDWDGLSLVLRERVPPETLTEALDQVDDAVRQRSAQLLLAALDGIVALGPADGVRSRPSWPAPFPPA
jgi:FlaA1/EpsC-like NDP-sugar epimerase/tetratricopeptide (TPR) repeat protein